MHRPQLITWITHSREHTTLLGQHTLKSQHNSTRLQEALLYTALHYTYMCNIVAEFYLYSTVYIYLINSRLDVTTSVCHHFHTATLSWCQISGKSREEFTVIKLTHNTINSRRNLYTCTAFQEAFQEDFEYSDFFRDHQLQPQHIGDVRRDYIQIVDSNWDLKAVLIQVSYNQYKSFRATELQELQSFETRASEQGTKIQNTVEVN